MWRRHLTILAELTWSGAIRQYRKPCCGEILLSSRNCWKETEQKGCWTNTGSHSRAKWDLLLTAWDIKSRTCSFKTTARMTFHLPSMNPVLTVAEAQPLHLYCISGCHGKSPPSCADREAAHCCWGPGSRKQLKATVQLCGELALRSTCKITLRFVALYPSHQYRKAWWLTQQAYGQKRPQIAFTA